MDKYDLASDPCDRRIIRFNNFMQLLSCVCQLAAIFVPELRDAADLIELIATLVYMTTAGCMFAQVNVELEHRAKDGGASLNQVAAGAAKPAYATPPGAYGAQQPVAYAQPPPGAAAPPPAYGAPPGQWNAPPPQQAPMGRY